jgi:23S rRNA pseudouridine1911/1915/1917 synthase
VAFEFKSESFRCDAESPWPLERVLKDRFVTASWNEVRRLITTGKVLVNAARASDTRQLVSPGATISIRMTARKLKPGLERADERILYCDQHLVVVRKPVGLSSVEHVRESTSLQSELRAWLSDKEKRSVAPLRVVHRLDKVTSGVMMFARSQSVQLDLKDQFRAHTTRRHYVAVAHGTVHDGTLSFRLVRDRGDGIRGVTRSPNLGRHSVTHVKVIEQLMRCCVLECRLETGRTHQIRIHLAEIGHPLVGESLYLRGYEGTLLSCSRTLLHAASLSFMHPALRKRLHFTDPLPSAFESFLERERRLS